VGEDPGKDDFTVHGALRTALRRRIGVDPPDVTVAHRLSWESEGSFSMHPFPHYYVLRLIFKVGGFQGANHRVVSENPRNLARFWTHRRSGRADAPVRKSFDARRTRRARSQADISDRRAPTSLARHREP